MLLQKGKNTQKGCDLMFFHTKNAFCRLFLLEVKKKISTFAKNLTLNIYI